MEIIILKILLIILSFEIIFLLSFKLYKKIDNLIIAEKLPVVTIAAFLFLESLILPFITIAVSQLILNI